jgi:hypothetical protein
MPSQCFLNKYGADTGRSNSPDLARSPDIARVLTEGLHSFVQNISEMKAVRHCEPLL